MSRDTRDERPAAEAAAASSPGPPALEDGPAPVATEQGMFGQPPVVVEALEESGAGAGRRLLLWLVGALLAAAAALWLTVLTVAQATDEEVALVALERGVAALTDVEALLDLQLEAVQEQADAGAAKLAPPGFPVRDAGVPAGEATRPDGTVDRMLLLDGLLSSSARLVYMRGVDAFREGDAEPQRASRLSLYGGIRALLNGLSSDNHDTAVVWLWPLGGACLLLGALLLVLAAGFGRFLALGVALMVAATPVLLAGLVARLALELVDAGPDDRLAAEFVAIGRQLAALAVRNALWLGAAGIALAVPAALLGALFDRSVRRPAQGEAAS